MISFAGKKESMLASDIRVALHKASWSRVRRNWHDRAGENHARVRGQWACAVSLAGTHRIGLE